MTRTLRDLLFRMRSVWLSLALVGLFEAYHQVAGLERSASPFLGVAFGLLLIYVAFAQGLRFAVPTLVVAITYQLWELSLPGHPFAYALRDTEALLAVSTAYIATVGLAAGLRQRLERTVRLEADRAAALAVADELRTTNAELHRLADELRARNEQIEAVVATRTQELAAEKSLLDRIIHHVPAAVVYLDAELHVRLVNETFAAMSGLLKADVIGRPYYDVIPAPVPNPRLEAVRRTLEPVHGTGLSYRVVRDGRETVMHVDNVYLPIFSESSQLEGILIMGLDVSARVEFERLQEERIESLQEVDRLKGDFINVASHELRTPLTSIRGYAEFLEDLVAGPLTPDQLSFVAQIQEGAHRLQRIVDDMLDFARLEAGTFSLVWQEACLVQLIHEEVSSLTPQLQDAGLTLELRLGPEPAWVRMDPRRIGQVLLNLMSNAIKFTPPGGSLVVRSRVAAGTIRVEVQDTGIGVSPESQPRLFDKFYQVDPSSTRTYGGAGLGLAISKAIVEGHGGTIGVASTPGEGSTFWFTLPQAAPVATASAHAV